MFEKASRMKLRFNTNKGIVSVEDLWDFSLRDLDEVAMALNVKVKESSKKSFITKRKQSDVVSKLRFSLVKQIIDVKLAEAEEAEMRAVNKLKKEKILGIISEKEDDSLKEMSTKELRKMVKSL